MTETNTAADTANETTTTAKPKRERKAKVVKTKTKAELARAIFRRFSRGANVNRAKVIELFQKEAGLTPAGASTYFQKLRSEKGAGKAKAA